MEEGGLLRVVCSDGTAYIFENGKFKGKSGAVDARYELSKDNIVRNGGFEEVEAVLAESRWQPAAWETWDGGRPTWGGETQTNAWEDAAYRSEGLKSLIMHSESRYLMQQLPAGALKPHTAYLLTYDYWTSEGTGNGNTTYRILFDPTVAGETSDLPGTRRRWPGGRKEVSPCLYRLQRSCPVIYGFLYIGVRRKPIG